MLDDKEKLDKIRHSLSHLLAASILKKYPGTKLGIGPVIENGFYYDFLFPKNTKIKEEDLTLIENDIKKLIKSELPFKGREISPEEAKKKLSPGKNDQPFKIELINELAENDNKISLYKTGNVFLDLCKGGHVKNTKEINPDAFKLTKIAGAYWRGDENNQMLTRIYGVAFDTKGKLDKYLKKLEEAEKRDHRKLGKKLDLFTFSETVGSGLPLWTPKGTIIRDELKKSLLEASSKFNVLPVTIPHIAKIDLYKKSGHAEKFQEELFRVVSHYDQDFILKPVNCPHHTQIYASQPRSYKDLPLRYMESTMQYRDEKPGELGGLTRVRSITVDDGHTFCRLDQIKKEVKNLAHIIENFYTGLGLFGNHWVSLSVRDPARPDDYIGEQSDWGEAEKMLQEASDELSLKAKRIEGEAAIYGPKLDYIFKDSLDREWQLATIQIDFAMPKRFGLKYTDNQGQNQIPVMIHRAILGSYERFMAILIEHFAGAFPLWLSPDQVWVLPISEGYLSYGEEIKSLLKSAGIRTTMPEADETLNKRIRQAEFQKIPYVAVVGDKEQTTKSISVRKRGGEDLGIQKLDDFIKKLQQEINNRTL